MFAKKLFAVAISLALLLPITSFAQKADDARMVEDSIAPFVSSRLAPADRQFRVDQYYSRTIQWARQSPRRELAASIVFTRGLSPAEVATLVDAYSLELVSAVVKTPKGDRGIIMTIDIGFADILKWRGSLDQKLEKAIGSFRLKFLEEAAIMEQAAPDEVDYARTRREMARGPMAIYRIEAFGPSVRISDIVHNETVALVVPHRQDRMEGAIESFKEYRQRVKDAENLQNKREVRQ